MPRRPFESVVDIQQGEPSRIRDDVIVDNSIASDVEDQRCQRKVT